jgi:polygalacturonase
LTRGWTASHHIVIDGVTIRNNEGGKGPSTDGIDIDSSHDILVAHADIDFNDDALCLKAGRDADGFRANRPTENVGLRDSIIRHGAADLLSSPQTDEKSL